MIEFRKHILKPISLKDHQALHELMSANQSRFKRFFPSTLQANLTLQGARDFAQLKEDQFKSGDEFLFVIHDQDRPVGLIYIKELDWHEKEGEFAYCIDHRSESKGIISEAVKLLSVHAFDHLGLKTLKIIAHKDNIASIQVARKAGFNWQETLKKSFTPPDEEPQDMELYLLTKNH